MKLPNWLAFFLAGVFTAVILHAIYKRPQKPQHIIQTEKVVETLQVIRPLPAETVRTQKVIRISDTLVDTVEVVRVIDWKLYEFKDAHIRAQIEADTVRKFSYTLLQKQKTKEAGILLNTQSIVFYIKPARNFIVVAGWNFQRKTPEIAVGVSAKW